MLVNLLMHLPVATNGELQLAGQRIHHRHTNAVQTARNLVGVVIELTTGMQYGHDNFGGRDTLFLVDIHGDTTAVVLDGDGLIRMDNDRYFIAMTCQRFVNGVIDHFKDHMVQTGTIVGVTNVHPRALADSIQAFKDLDVGCVVILFTHVLSPKTQPGKCSADQDARPLLSAHVSRETFLRRCRAASNLPMRLYPHR